MTAFYLGPLGRLRPLDLVQRGASAQADRASSSFVTLGGRRFIQRAPAGPRDWSLSLGARRDASLVAHLAACASGALPGPLFLYTGDAARTNLLPADVAAPGRAGSTALGSVAGSVAVGMPSGVESLTGVVQQATAGAWSASVPLLPDTAYVLSGWSSAAGAAVEWRTVSAGGVPVASGTLATAAVDGGFYGAVEVASGTAAGVQVRLAAGSRTVGGLRLVEGVLPTSGTVTRRNLVPNPSFEAGVTGWSASGAPSVGRTTTLPFAGRVGDFIGYIVGDGSSPYAGAAATVAGWEAGQWVAARAWLATELVGSGVVASLRLRFTTPGGTTSVSTQWRPAQFYAGRYFTVAGQVPAGATGVEVQARIYSGSESVNLSSGSRMWLDQVIASTAATEVEARNAVVGSDPLAAWRDLAASRTAQVVAIGDSITEGAGASNIALRWQTILQSALRGSSTGAQFPFLPAYPATGAGVPVTRTGNVIANASYGMGGRTAVVQDGGQVAFTFTGTSCQVMHTRGSGTGVMSVQIDGGTPVVVDTNSASGASSNAALWSSGPLTAGAHTVTVTRHSSSAAGQHVYLQGLLTYNGDERGGVRVLDSAHSGWSTKQMVEGTPDRISRMSTAVQAAGGADLATIAFGTNDPVNSVTAADFEANVRRMIAALRADGFDGPVLLIGMYRGNTVPDDPFRQYAEGMARIASEDKMVAFLDLRGQMPDVPTPHTAPSGQGFYADGLHPSDLGHSKIASLVNAALTGAPTGSSGYFDGATPPAPGRYITWDGTPHASSSTEYILPDGATLPGWMPGRGVPQVVVDDPTETLQLVTSREVLADYQVTIREVG